MEAFLPQLNTGDVESMEGGLLPSDLYPRYQQQQQQMMTDWFYSPLPQMPVALRSYSPTSRPLSMDQFLTQLCLQSNWPRAALHHQHMEPVTCFLLRQEVCDLVRSRERILELEACLRRAEEETETWQRIAKEHESTIASLNRTLEQLREPSTASSPDAGDAATRSSHPLAVKEPREGTGMGLCKSCGSRNCHVLLLSCRHLCACQLCEASLGACPRCRSVKEGSIEAPLICPQN